MNRLERFDGCVVVGSGPSGAMAVHRLLASGQRVLHIDRGITLDPVRAEIKARMARQWPEAWAPEDVARLRAPHVHDGGLGAKTHLGSAHAFEQVADSQIVYADQVRARASFARGGLSTIWGAAMLPVPEADLRTWLVGDELAPYWDEVAEIVPLAASVDGLAERFAVPARHDPALTAGTVGTAVLARATARVGRLRGFGAVAGAGRLAVRNRGGGLAGGCIACGQCVTGCVYDHIWSGEHLLAEFSRDPAYRSLSPAVVRRVSESANRVEIEVSGADGTDRVEADRVFLACGPISSVAILQRSGLVTDRVVVHDSQMQIVPCLVTLPVARRREVQPTLAQVFVHVADDDGRSLAQVQLYSDNDTLVERARALQPWLRRVPAGVLERSFPNFMTAMIFYSSRLSGTLSCSLEAGGTVVRGIDRPAGEIGWRSVRGRIDGALRTLGLAPLWRLEHVATPGESHHIGAGLPMTADPGPGQTDRLGRPGGTERIHVVDSSVLPDIPAGPMTYPAMANALRIASAFRA